MIQNQFTMNSHFSRLSAVARPRASLESLSLPAAFAEQLTVLYGLVQRSRYVFGSPLGPFTAGAKSFDLARFVYFGPHSSDASVRLAFVAGFDHHDLRPTLSLLHFVESLALKPDIGQGLNLSFFPLVDVLGLAGLAGGRKLADEDWSKSSVPEIGLLEREARLRSYHGFVRVESAPGQDIVSVSLRGAPRTENLTPDLELISSDDIEPFAVRWESPSGEPSGLGCLGVAADVVLQPSELTLRLPASWSSELYRQATASILRRFVLRYRAFLAYGQHL